MVLKKISDILGSRRAIAITLTLSALVVASIIVSPFYLSRSAPGPDGNPVSKPISTHDMAQHLAVMSQFDLVLRTGIIYPRWQPDFNKGYGLAWTNFYQPGFFYQTSLVNLVFNDWIKTLFALSILGLAASGLTFYLLARLFYNRWAAAIAALLYMILPYHTLDLYWRGAMPELQGFILVPLILYFAFKAGAEAKSRHMAGLGLFLWALPADTLPRRIPVELYAGPVRADLGLQRKGLEDSVAYRRRDGPWAYAERRLSAARVA